MTLKVDDCKHIAVFLCDQCDDVHIASFAGDNSRTGQVLIPRDSMNAIIIELMKLRDQLNLKVD